MQLDALTVALRPRTPWEATDLGIAMVRAHARRIWLPWLILSAPLMLALTTLGCVIGVPALGLYLVWWLKPAFDRIALFVLSRALFGEYPNIRQTIQAQMNFAGLWPWLLWRRFDPRRSLLMPVDVLEHLHGPARKERVRVLNRAAGNASWSMMMLGSLIEVMIVLSLIAFVVMLVPVEFLPDTMRALWEKIEVAPPLWVNLVLIGFCWLAQVTVEPFYAGAGFGLYINGRTRLEAWDVEMAFRKMAARLAPVVMSVLFFGWMLAVPDTAWAKQDAPAKLGQSAGKSDTDTDTDTESESESESEDYEARAEAKLPQMFQAQPTDVAAFKGAVAQSMKNEDLSPKETVKHWVPKNAPEFAPPKDERNYNFAGMSNAIAEILHASLWVLLAIAVVLLVRFAMRYLPEDAFERKKRTLESAGEQEIVADAPMPADLIGAVRALWQAGSKRAAMALFYRAAVVRLSETIGTPVPEGSTESDCVRRAQKLANAQFGNTISQVVRSWQDIAYAGRALTDADLETLFLSWNAAGQPAQPVIAMAPPAASERGP
jgi:hypothetical protein